MGCLETIPSNGTSLIVCFGAAARMRVSQALFPVHLLSCWRLFMASCGMCVEDSWTALSSARTALTSPASQAQS